MRTGLTRTADQANLDMADNKITEESNARSMLLAATEFANEAAWKRPDLNILREQYKGQYSTFIEIVQEKILMSHRRGKLILPDLAAFGNNTVGVFSDYGGEHKEAQYLTYSVLVCSWDFRDLFSDKIKEIRQQYQMGKKEISYKDLRMGQMQRALPDYLLTLSNFLPGFLLNLVVHKNASEVFKSSAKETNNLMEAAFKSIGVEGRKPKVNEKLMRVTELVAFLTALLGKDGQKVFWMTDHDEISPTNAKHQETLKIFNALLNAFCRNNQVFSLVGGALPFDERHVGTLDLLSATDLCAGALTEYLTQREVREQDKIRVKPGCEYVLQWLAHDGIGLKKMNIIVRRGADQPIESAVIEFGLEDPPKDVTIIPISV